LTVLYWKERAPGLILSLILALIGISLQWAITRIAGYPILEALVLAMLAGILLRNTAGRFNKCELGLHFAAKQLLEFAVVLLGASINFRTVAHSGLTLAGSVAVLIFGVIQVSLFVGKRVGISRNTALLVGIGNGVCGNSAIAAAAPVISALPEEVASSIGFTAVLSVIVVLVLPLLPKFIHLSDGQYGIVAGLVVYAVPQVLAATYMVSSKSVAMATLVKLTRVLFLTPIVIILSLMHKKTRAERVPYMSLALQMVPWFMIGFMGLASLRTFGIFSQGQADHLREVGRLLTVLSMGAIGMNTDLRNLGKSSRGIVFTVFCSLLFLLAGSLIVCRLIPT